MKKYIYTDFNIEELRLAQKSIEIAIVIANINIKNYEKELKIIIKEIKKRK